MKRIALFFAVALTVLLMNALVFAQDTTLTITGSGNVGIGTTSPGSKLHVLGSVGVGNLPRFSNHMFSSRVDSSSVTTDVAVFGSNQRTSGFAVGVLGRSSAATGFGVYSQGNFQTEGNATITGNVGIGTTSPSTKLTIQTSVNQHGLRHRDGTHDLITWLGTSEGTEGAWIGPTTPYALSLQTGNIARLTVSASGNVGIGTVSPEFKLQVAGEIKVQNGVVRFGDSTSHRWTIGPQIADDGYVIYANGAAGYVLVLNRTSGNVGIGTTSPDQKLSVNGNASKVGGGSWATFSDRRLKKDIRSFRDGLSVLKEIRPVTFRYNGKLGYPTDKTYVGVVAQEVQSVAPYTVDTYRTKLNTEDTEETDVLRFDPSALSYITINAVKELDQRVEEIQTLRDENRKLSARLTELESLVKTLAEANKSIDGKSIGELR